MRARRAVIVGVLYAIAMTAASRAASPAGAPARAHPQRWPRAHSVGLVDAATEAFIADLIARMTLAEKVGQLIQADISSIQPQQLRDYPLGAVLAGGNSPLGGDDRDPPPASAQTWLATTRAFHAIALERRRGHVPIPLLFGVDAVHGNNGVLGATVFPHSIGLGAAHDSALIRHIGAATAHEAVALGVDWALAPTLAVPQDARWGRSYESYSQDPVLVRRYADAMVRGLQGDPDAKRGVARGHVAAAAKHFIGDGGTTEGVDQGNSQISEQELIRLHAGGYQAAIDAGVMTVMASYSSWQGEKIHGNASLLTGVLKQRMGFDGFVVGDWNGHAQLPGCSASSCAAALNAGLDMYMAPDGWKPLFDNLLSQVRAGEISLARLEDAVRRVLRVKAKLGLFESPRPWEGRLQLIGSAAHQALARQAVRESLVLLKNNQQVLPIRASARVLVAGPMADDIGRQCGGWTLSWQGASNTNADFPDGQSIYAAVRDALAAGGGSAQLSVDGSYTDKPDVAIVVFGEQPYAESAGDLNSLALPHDTGPTLALLQRLHAAQIPVISVLISGRPLWVNPELNASDAFVAAWLPGSQGAGIADLLIGDDAGRARHDFRGRLSFAWPSSVLPPMVHSAASIAASGRQPLFALGYGLRYRSPRRMPLLAVDPGG